MTFRPSNSATSFTLRELEEESLIEAGDAIVAPRTDKRKLLSASNPALVAAATTLGSFTLERRKPFARHCRILERNMPVENEVLLRNFLEGEESRLRSAVPTSTESDP